MALCFTIDRALEQGSWLDYGMFVQSVMLAAKAYGLDTCPQSGLNAYHAVIQKVIDWPESDMLVCAMSIGYQDPNAIVNTLVTERIPLESFVRYHN
jgi:nitroreductase